MTVNQGASTNAFFLQLLVSNINKNYELTAVYIQTLHVASFTIFGWVSDMTTISDGGIFTSSS